MLKSIFFYLILLASIFSSAYAGEFYAGVGVGRNTVNFQKKLTISNTQSEETFYNKNDNQPEHGFLKNIFGGYGINFTNHSYFSGEINVLANSLEYHGYITDRTGKQIEAKYTLNKGYGISILPGYIFSNWLLYGRIGIARGDFTYSEYNKAFSPGKQMGIAEGEWLDGFRYGLGISGMVTHNISVRLDYSHTNYQTFTNNNV